MAEKKYQPPKNLENPFLKNLDEFQAMYEASIKDPKTFFGNQAEENLSWGHTVDVLEELIHSCSNSNVE